MGENPAKVKQDCTHYTTSYTGKQEARDPQSKKEIKSEICSHKSDGIFYRKLGSKGIKYNIYQQAFIQRSIYVVHSQLTIDLSK